MCRAKIVHLPAEVKAAKKEEPSTTKPSLTPSVIEFTTHQPYLPPTPPPEDRLRRRQMKPWKLIPTECFPDCLSMEHFPEGWKFNVYDGRLTCYFEIPSELVAPTHGAIRYIEHYNEVGPYSRFRFQICHNYACGKCTKGFNCTYIHAQQLPQSNVIHVNGMLAYETLPPGMSMFVHVPGSNGAPQLIPSEYILCTAGSRKLFEDALNGDATRINRPQHCAHYQFKKVCNRGTACSFIHSLIPAQQE